MATKIHPTAVIAPDVQLGVDVRIGPYVIVEADVSIGDGTYLESFSLVKRYTEMGARNHVHPHAVIGGEPQHTAYKDEPTKTRIGDNNQFRECVTIHRGTVQGDGETVIGSNCMLMAYAHVAHDCIIGNNVIMANAVNLAGHVNVGNNVIISGLAAVQQFVRIGNYAFLGGHSGYNLDVPPFMLAHGVRGSLLGLNLIGLRRNGFSKESVSALKKAYKILFNSGLKRQDAADQAAAELGDNPEVMQLVEFVRSSKNGVTPAVTQKNGNSNGHADS